MLSSKEVLFLVVVTEEMSSTLVFTRVAHILTVPPAWASLLSDSFVEESGFPDRLSLSLALHNRLVGPTANSVELPASRETSCCLREACVFLTVVG